MVEFSEIPHIELGCVQPKLFHTYFTSYDNADYLKCYHIPV